MVMMAAKEENKRAVRDTNKAFEIEQQQGSETTTRLCRHSSCQIAKSGRKSQSVITHKQSVPDKNHYDIQTSAVSVDASCGRRSNEEESILHLDLLPSLSFEFSL